MFTEHTGNRYWPHITFGWNVNKGSIKACLRVQGQAVNAPHCPSDRLLNSSIFALFSKHWTSSVLSSRGIPRLNMYRPFLPENKWNIRRRLTVMALAVGMWSYIMITCLQYAHMCISCDQRSTTSLPVISGFLEILKKCFLGSTHIVVYLVGLNLRPRNSVSPVGKVLQYN